MASTTSKSALIHRRLYRALLRAAKPLTPPSPKAAVLCSLLHRSFVPLESDETLARDICGILDEDGEDYHLDPSLPKRYDAHFLLFRRLMWTLFSDTNSYSPLDPETKQEKIPKYQWPSQVQPYKLRDLIRQEFRAPDKYSNNTRHFPPPGLSGTFPIKARQDAAFLALRKLNEKLAWADELEASQKQQQSSTSPKQSAKHVEPLWTTLAAAQHLSPREALSSAYLKPGNYLVAHPHLTGFFHQTVVCILQHGSSDANNNNEEKEEEEGRRTEPGQAQGTYGIVVNKPSLSEVTGRNRTLSDSLNFQLPNDIAIPLGGAPIKEGGPVNMPSIQMLHSSGCFGDAPVKVDEEREEVVDIGGTALPSVTGLADEKMVCYEGKIVEAARAVTLGQLDRDDVSFFLGASTWSQGQLEKELREGCWLLCSGPADIALSGVCEHEPTEEGEQRPKADLWLSMLSACGEEEAKFAHLMQTADAEDAYGDACDEF